MSKHTKLTKPERVLISEWKKQGLCGNEIANRLGRDRSTIGRELKRNKTKVRVGKYDEEIYEPEYAQFVTDQRKQKAWSVTIKLSQLLTTAGHYMSIYAGNRPKGGKNQAGKSTGHIYQTGLVFTKDLRRLTTGGSLDIGKVTLWKD